MTMSAKRTAKSKEPAAKRAGELSECRWGVGFSAAIGAEIRERSTKRGTKPAIWIREAAIMRLERDREADKAAPPPPRR
jgi:hypothetical protein